jgi:D-aspartate ligase
MNKHPNRPPVIVLGGSTIALAVCRSLGRRGIPVFVLDEPESYARRSRYCTWIPLEGSGDGIRRPTLWLEWLTDEGIKKLEGAVLIPCCDQGLEVVARHRRELEDKYRVIEANDKVLLSMLDKQRTLELAHSVGMAAPRMWSVNSLENLARIRNEITYPCAVKPRHSYVFLEHFGGLKLFVAHDPNEMTRLFERMYQREIEVIISEIIPGGDDEYCSYYTYLDESGKALFHFTKRKIRQYPNRFGLGTYHCTDWNPEVAKVGLSFFKEVGLRGLGNVEFKRDSRDGKLKLIECNLRMTLVTELIVQAGIDLPLFVYNRLTRQPLPPVSKYRTGLYTVRPVSDYLAFREMHRRGELSWFGWVRSLLRRQCFLHFKWYDPMPTFARLAPFISKQISRLGVYVLGVTKSKRHVDSRLEVAGN